MNFRVFCFLFLLLAGSMLGSCGSNQSGQGTTDSNTRHYAWVSDNNGYVWKCGLDVNTGTLSSCAEEAQVPSGDIGYDYSGIALGTFGGNTYAYLSNVQFNNTPVLKCSVNSSSGEVSSCAATAGDANYGWTPDGVTFYSIGAQTYAYVPDGANTLDSNNSYVWLCSVNSSNGEISGCSKTPSDTSLPATADRYEVLTVNAIGGKTYAYVPDFGGGYVWECQVNSTTAALSGCVYAESDTSLTDWGTGSTFSAIAFWETTGVTSAYIADYAGYVWQCTVSSSTGLLGGCAITPSDASLPATPFSYSGLTFERIGSGVSAFIADSGGDVWKCSVSASTGAFSGCTQDDSGASGSGWSPDAIVFQ